MRSYFIDCEEFEDGKEVKSGAQKMEVSKKLR
jgi:hypothetical protein